MAVTERIHLVKIVGAQLKPNGSVKHKNYSPLILKAIYCLIAGCDKKSIYPSCKASKNAAQTAWEIYHKNLRVSYYIVALGKKILIGRQSTQSQCPPKIF